MNVRLLSAKERKCMWRGSAWRGSTRDKDGPESLVVVVLPGRGISAGCCGLLRLLRLLRLWRALRYAHRRSESGVNGGASPLQPRRASLSSLAACPPQVFSSSRLARSLARPLAYSMAQPPRPFALALRTWGSPRAALKASSALPSTTCSSAVSSFSALARGAAPRPFGAAPSCCRLCFRRSIAPQRGKGG